MLRNKQQNKILHALLAKMGIDRSTNEGREILEEMVYNVTNGRTSSTSKMLINECSALISHLRVMKDLPAGQKDPADAKRKKCLSICREMGGEWFKDGQYNWNHINQWLFKYGYLHKGLNSYKLAELPKLINQFEQLLKAHYAKREV